MTRPSDPKNVSPGSPPANSPDTVTFQRPLRFPPHTLTPPERARSTTGIFIDQTETDWEAFRNSPFIITV